MTNSKCFFEAAGGLLVAACSGRGHDGYFHLFRAANDCDGGLDSSADIAEDAVQVVNAGDGLIAEGYDHVAVAQAGTLSRARLFDRQDDNSGFAGQIVDNGRFGGGAGTVWAETPM